MATELAAIDQPVPRGLMYVEQVKFTEPYRLQLIGGDDQRLETFLAQKGLRSEDDLKENLPFHPKDKPIVTPYPPTVTPYPPGGNGGGAPPGGGSSPGGGGVLCTEGMVPVGGIIMYSGALIDLPNNWRLCDGTGDTPDLRNRFIVGSGDTYAIGDTGGNDTVDISHQHAAGTLVGDNESAHTHGDGSYAAANDTHDHNDTLSIDNDTHDHSVNAGTTANDAHQHDGVSLTAQDDLNHVHTHGTYSAIATGNTTSVQSGAGATVPTAAHTHNLTGSSSTTSHGHSIAGLVGSDSHSHGPGTLDTDNDQHNHGISGSISNDTHNHDVTGTSGTGSAHGHTISGNTATGGNAAHDNRPQFYALAFIMKVAECTTSTSTSSSTSTTTTTSSSTSTTTTTSSSISTSTTTTL